MTMSNTIPVKDSFHVKGFHLDLRIQVMTPEALRHFAKELVDFGLNTLVVEWEGSFPFEQHARISNRYAYTRKEIKSFIAYCQTIGLDVIPLQQCFGHTEYILRHQRYAHLRENKKEISQVCPSKEDALRSLFTEIFTDIASLHPSVYFHIGGDETYLLGDCEICRVKASAEGKSKLFVDYIKVMCDILIGLGKTPIMWADIILKYPEAVDLLPKETIFVDWNYGWKNDHFGNISHLLEKGCTFWGAPALRSHPDDFYCVDYQKHFQNLHDYIPYSRKSNYSGVIMTSWSTSGIYSYEWDDGFDLIEMVAVRHVYPLSGFRILLAAYSTSLHQDTPLAIKPFVFEYGKERFGFKENENTQWFDLMLQCARPLWSGKSADGIPVNEILKTTQASMQKIARIKVKKNKKEWEHFKLLLSIRELTLQVRVLEGLTQSEDYRPSKKRLLLKQIPSLLKKARQIDKAFFKAQSGFLYGAEIQSENRIRNRRLFLLQEILSGNKTAISN